MCSSRRAESFTPPTVSRRCTAQASKEVELSIVSRSGCHSDKNREVDFHPPPKFLNERAVSTFEGPKF